MRARGPAANLSRSENCEEVQDAAPGGRGRGSSTSRASGAADSASFAIRSPEGAFGRASRPLCLLVAAVVFVPYLAGCRSVRSVEPVGPETVEPQHAVSAVEPEGEAGPSEPRGDEPPGEKPDGSAPPEGETPESGTGGESSPDAEGGSFRERWRRLLEATRGLVTWEFLDGRLTMQARIKAQVDGTVVSEGDLVEENFGDLDNGIDVRRFRLYGLGTIDRHLRYTISYELGTDRGLKDAFVEGVDHGLSIWGYEIGKFRLGTFKEPFSLERQSGGYETAFLERSLPVWTFAPGRNIGFMLHDTAREGRISWAAGFFSFGSRNEDNASASTLSITGRITALPIYRDDGRTLLHVGASFSSREPRSNEVHYRARPEARYISYFIDTGVIEASKSRLYGLEGAWVQGPLWVQTEGILASVESKNQGNLGFWGTCLQAGYFLTGEVRPYNQSNGTFGRPEPGSDYEGGRPFKKESGGALEVTARYSYLDLDDNDVRGGRLRDLTVGLNWYLSPTSRVAFNYVHSTIEGGGTAKILLVRYQYNPW